MIEVKIDGEVFAVESDAEAESLIAQTRQLADEKARADARVVVKKRRTSARRDKKPLRLDSILLDTPQVLPVSDGSAELAQRIQAQLDATYAAAARDADIALHMYQRLMLDEDEAIVLLLLDE